MVLGTFWFSWGLVAPPLNLRGFETRFLFHPNLQICMLGWGFWPLFVSTILQPILLQIGFERDP